MELSRLTIVKAVGSTSSILITLLFMCHHAGSSTQDRTLIILFYSTLAVVLIAVEAYVWNYAKFEKTWVEISVRCSNKCIYDIHIDGKRYGYRGAIDDKLYCKEGYHTISVRYGQLEKTIEVLITGSLHLDISLGEDIRIYPTDCMGVSSDESIRIQAKVGAIYVILCYVMMVIIISTIIMNEIRANI